MNILLLTKTGEGFGLAHRLVQEGHDVTVYGTQIDLSSHSGIFKKSANLWDSLKDVKFVITDSTGWPQLHDKLKFYNRIAIGTHPILELANVDAYRQYELFQRFGLLTPETKVFNDIGEMFEGAIDWEARQTTIKYGAVELHCNYQDWLSWGMTKVSLDQKIVFQKTSTGVEYQISGWFNGIRWLDSFSISPDISGKLYNYAVAYPLPIDHRFVTETIFKLEPLLKTLEYHGPVHIKIAVGKSEILCTRFYAGFKYPLTYTMLEFVQDELGEFLHNVALGSTFQPKKTKDYVSVVQSLCTETGLEGAPILGINNERLKHMVFHSVGRDADTYRLACGSVVFTASAHGPTLADSTHRVYATVENVKYPEKHYNSNLLGLAHPFFSKLEDWKYI